MSRNGTEKMDVRTAWNSWAASGSDSAAAAFLEQVKSWTEGTAAQLSREAHYWPAPMTRDEVSDRLRHHLGVVAAGGPVTYLEALSQARGHVIAELRKPL